MSVEFADSARGTVGLEWEVALVDLTTRELTPRGHELLALLSDDTRVSGEYLACMVELVSGVHSTIGDAVADLAEQLAEVQDAAASLGLGVLAAGTHPFSRGIDQEVVETPTYAVVKERNAWWGRRMIACGTHVHVGVDRRELAMPVTNGLARFYPHLSALSASSPFFEGEDTGFASQRTMLFQQLATNGLPYPFATWAEFEAYVAQLISVGMIKKPTEIRWDVRPAPRFGTVEARIADASPTLAELGCIAAWTQCLAVYGMQTADRGRAGASLPRWIVQENKWRAARYGLDADIILLTAGEKDVPLRTSLERWYERLTPVADDLGCRHELDLTPRILARGNSAERQRRVAASSDGDLVAVVDALLTETRTGRFQ
ncbi:glutamate--cysteine ligase [Nigerium massiliense]|uniref:glutamate--cysteine ligase n=1 Tax=Nigerium massiliense TaxID=1522317 RepID=UPI00058C2F35|nr:glutamate--cysteine ligase [Nigerium massiliense]